MTNAIESKLRILLVDDDVLTRKVLCRFLNSAGYAVDLCADGTEALNLLRTSPRYDVLVTDFLMPGLTGLELLRAARELQKLPLRCIVITGQKISDEIRDDSRTLVSAWFEKPFDLDALMGAIDDCER